MLSILFPCRTLFLLYHFVPKILQSVKFYEIPTKLNYDFSHHDYIPYYAPAPNSCKFLTCDTIKVCSIVSLHMNHVFYLLWQQLRLILRQKATKISARVYLFGIFEIGGEASAGGSYKCSFTKSRIMTENVECSVSSTASSTLQIFNVQSDLECQF